MFTSIGMLSTNYGVVLGLARNGINESQEQKKKKKKIAAVAAYDLCYFCI